MSGVRNNGSNNDDNNNGNNYDFKSNHVNGIVPRYCGTPVNQNPIVPKNDALANAPKDLFDDADDFGYGSTGLMTGIKGGLYCSKETMKYVMFFIDDIFIPIVFSPYFVHSQIKEAFNGCAGVRSAGRVYFDANGKAKTWDQSYSLGIYPHKDDASIIEKCFTGKQKHENYCILEVSKNAFVPVLFCPNVLNHAIFPNALGSRYTYAYRDSYTVRSAGILTFNKKGQAIIANATAEMPSNADDAKLIDEYFIKKPSATNMAPANIFFKKCEHCANCDKGCIDGTMYLHKVEKTDISPSGVWLRGKWIKFRSNLFKKKIWRRETTCGNYKSNYVSYGGGYGGYKGFGGYMGHWD